MKVAICKLKSETPYSQSRPMEPTEADEQNRTKDEVDELLWRQRMHVNDAGHVFIPPMSFANSLKEAAQFLSINIPGKGKATYTKNFDAGVFVTEPLVLDVLAKDIVYEKLFVPSDGRRGGGSRVWRRFPLVPNWSGNVSYYVVDEKITEDVFDRVLRASGLLIGIGRFRPRNRGYYGRFTVEGIKWQTA